MKDDLSSYWNPVRHLKPNKIRSNSRMEADGFEKTKQECFAHMHTNSSPSWGQFKEVPKGISNGPERSVCFYEWRESAPPPRSEKAWIVIWMAGVVSGKRNGPANTLYQSRAVNVASNGRVRKLSGRFAVVAFRRPPENGPFRREVLRKVHATATTTTTTTESHQ